MKKIIIKQGETVFQVNTEESSLMKVLQKEGISTAFPCSGNGSCGKCKVEAVGHLSPLSSQEKALLPAENSGDIRLACQVVLLGDGTITLPSQGQWSHVLLHEETAPLLYDGNKEDIYGISVDIGTTTIASYLYHLPTGRLCSSIGEMNEQYRFGADVIARIEYSNQNGHEILHQTLMTQLHRMFLENVTREKISLNEIDQLVITGNTTMLHFLTNKNPRGIGVSPFIPESLFGETMAASKLFSEFSPNAMLYLPPCISAYVGADISCGIVSTNLTQSGENSLLIDIGTNGEMMLFTKGTLISCATAAGPAFEGRDIVQGMPAAPGAINHVYVGGDEILYTTIDDAPPCGICGTGIISVIDTMLAIGALEDTGAVAEEGHSFTRFIVKKNGQPAFSIGDSGVFITQQDIRNIQLAKAAISAGIDTMLHHAKLAPDNISATYLAGGFGNYIVPKEAVGIGLLPKELLPHLKTVGNSAGEGAAHLLFSMAKRQYLKEIAGEIVDLELSSNSYFMESYMDNMMFPAEVLGNIEKCQEA